jgi:threonine aldolase
VGTRAIEVENTHNRGGGAVYPLERLREIRVLADHYKLGLHMDGARLWNAHVATGVPLKEYGDVADTLSVCLSKGLGAPVGSVLLLPADRSEEARRMRHRLGGGMRQAGILAAAGLYALEHNVSRLSKDHENAARLAATLVRAGASVRPPETNIVLVDVPNAPAAAAACAEKGVKISAFGPKLLRIVTHLDVSAEDCDAAADVVSSVLMQSPDLD